MRHRLITLCVFALAGSLANPLVAQEKLVTPSASDATEATELADASLGNIVTQLEFIELDHKSLTKLLFNRQLKGDATKLRDEVQLLIKEKKATIADVHIISAQSGNRTRITSTFGHVYPTEWEPSEQLKDQEDKKTKEVIKGLAIGPTPTAFEELPVGSVFEIEPTLDRGGIINLLLHSEVVWRAGYETWSTWKSQFDKTDVKLPKNYRIKYETGVTLKDNQYGFIGVLSPKNDKGEVDTTRKIMLFVRSSIVK